MDLIPTTVFNEIIRPIIGALLAIGLAFLFRYILRGIFKSKNRTEQTKE